jgi:hypothetical protein
MLLQATGYKVRLDCRCRALGYKVRLECCCRPLDIKSDWIVAARH